MNNNDIKKLLIGDMLGAVVSFIVVSYIISLFSTIKLLEISTVIVLIFLFRYFNKLGFSGFKKYLHILSVIVIAILSYAIDIKLITILFPYMLIVIFENNVKNVQIRKCTNIIFALLGYIIVLFFMQDLMLFVLLGMLLHILLILSREFFYDCTLIDEKRKDYLDIIQKQFFTGRFIIYIFFAYSPFPIVLKMVGWIYILLLFLIIDIPFIAFIVYLRLTHRNENFKRIINLITYSIPVFYIILLAGRLLWKY
jgi:hypothetical protein